MATYSPSKITKDGNTYNFTDANAVPRSGGAVMTGTTLGRNVNNSSLNIFGGQNASNGATICVYGKDGVSRASYIQLHPLYHDMFLMPDGTWTWSGSAVQITSDERYKQQIAEIDDKLLDAWEDVEPVQFKYNDAVDQKKDKARLHTGYVVQQIDKACKEHDVDISAYGLFCHEEYPERTEEVEVEQKDGTKTKERKVVREADEHYSLRYTETLVVECAYLRKKNRELQEQLDKLASRIEELEKRNNVK